MGEMQKGGGRAEGRGKGTVSMLSAALLFPRPPRAHHPGKTLSSSFRVSMETSLHGRDEIIDPQ